ncbi:ryncolin-4-like [Calliphora vicina]|uniref:ryncolin-4-like n=1 Tax=Calliphora vicina TaxID=7373 RepID=UPI00325BFA52
MYLNILCYCVLLVFINKTFGLSNQEEISALTYVDEIVVLKKIFNNLQEIKSSIDLWNSRYEEYRNIKETIEKDSSIFDIRFDAVPLKCKTDDFLRNCAEATSCTQRSGIYKILLEKFNSEPFLVECDAKTNGGGWILIQRRQDGSVDFYREWAEYQKGFGKIDGEFFIGLDKLHALTNYNGAQELLVVLEDKNEIKHAKYSNFVIGNEHQLYALQHLGDYSGNAGDSLIGQLGMKFTTRDQDNDIHGTLNCAQEFLGAWWYNKCHASNLNGKYGDTRYGKGVIWNSFRGINGSIKHVTMMIRRRRF